MTKPLERECACYRRLLPDLLARSEGKFALIRDDAIVAVCETERDAIRRGFEELGPVPFLVREIRRPPPAAEVERPRER